MDPRIEEDKSAGPPPDASEGAKVARVQSRIREMILTGELVPGHPIRERALADSLGVSRTPMREALKLLAAEYLVDLSPFRGATVTQITRADAYQVVQVLAALEGLAAELACTSISEDETAELRALHFELMAFRARRDRLGYFRANQQFHFTIAQRERYPVMLRGFL